jgi:hypothetical protein
MPWPRFEPNTHPSNKSLEQCHCADPFGLKGVVGVNLRGNPSICLVTRKTSTKLSPNSLYTGRVLDPGPDENGRCATVAPEQCCALGLAWKAGTLPGQSIRNTVKPRISWPCSLDLILNHRNDNFSSHHRKVHLSYAKAHGLVTMAWVFGEI